MKENKYDDERFFDQYSRMSRSVEGLAGAGEWHVLRRILPRLEGRTLLDLGCGYGWHCKYAVEHGAMKVVGIDLSEKMIEKARQINAYPRIEYRVAAVEDYEYPPKAFDVVLSSLTFHYLESFGEICQKVHDTLRAGGEFIFSAEHPVFTAQGSQQWQTDDNGRPLYWPVDNYFHEGRRTADFLGEQVVKYHKTLTTYIGTLLRHGFEITHFEEPKPSPEMLDRVEGMRDELRRPMMLIIGARKK